jgi:hypothetical protein
VPVGAESPDVREPVKEVTPVCDDVPETAIPVESWLALLLTIYRPLSIGHCAQYR